MEEQVELSSAMKGKRRPCALSDLSFRSGVLGVSACSCSSADLNPNHIVVCRLVENKEGN